MQLIYCPFGKQESPFKEREYILIACLSGKEHYGFGRCLTPKRPLNDFSRQFLYVSESFLGKNVIDNKYNIYPRTVCDSHGEGFLCVPIAKC